MNELAPTGQETGSATIIHFFCRTVFLKEVMALNCYIFWVNFMAKPISATPVLRGKDAIRFIEEMHRVEREPISKIDRETLKRLKKNAPFFESFFG